MGVDAVVCRMTRNEEVSESKMKMEMKEMEKFSE